MMIKDLFHIGLFKVKISIILSLYLLCYNFDAKADERNNAHQNFLAQYQTELQEIENYLENIKYLKASFIQETSDGDITEGQFYLSRPGKMRIEYNPPSAILIIVNGGVLAYQDLELEETSYLTTNSTPASFLTRKNISFRAKDVEITNLIKNKNYITVSVMKKNKKEAGEFSLIFQTNPLKFSRMKVKNDMDQTIIVAFTTTTFGEKIDNKLFIIKNSNLP